MGGKHILAVFITDLANTRIPVRKLAELFVATCLRAQAFLGNPEFETEAQRGLAWPGGLGGWGTYPHQAKP